MYFLILSFSGVYPMVWYNVDGIFVLSRNAALYKKCKVKERTGTYMSMQKTEQIRTGIVGCGDHSHVHGLAAGRLKDLKITACCDVVLDKARSWAEKYGCDSYYMDLYDMLSKEKLDAVILCTWPGQHMGQLEKCLAAGIQKGS